MARKRMMISWVKPGMVAAEDVLTTDGKLIIAKDTVFDEDILERLMQYSVFAVYIKEEEEEIVKQVKEELQKKSELEEGYLEKLKHSQKFVDFQKDYMHSVSDLENSLKSLAEGSGELQKEELLGSVNEVLDKTDNSLNLLDMLHCMRDYDDVTFVHSLNVGVLSNLIGRETIKRITDEELNVLTLAGMLHDVGKLMVPEDVLQKKGRLTVQEQVVVQTHALHGYNILKELDIDSRIAEAALCHHERCDGSGYPNGKGFNEIPQFAKIVAIADVYDAMTSNRIYREGISPFEVVSMFEEEGFFTFDIEYLLPFLNKVVTSYLHNRVHLSNDEIGKIVMINQGKLAKPVVQVGDTFRDLSVLKNISIDKVIT